MRPYVEALEKRRLNAVAIDLPRSNADRALPVFMDKVPSGAIAGGHSYGGRVGSMAATQVDYVGLVLLSYPLHRPGHPEDLRTEHWSKIRCPVLLLSGESDPFARVDLLRRSVRLLKKAELVTYSGVGHGLLPVIDQAMDQVAAFAQRFKRR